MTARPTASQAAAIAYFHDGTRSTVRMNQASYAACERAGWIEKTEKFPFHRATDTGIRAIGLEPPVHLHTGLGADKAVCGEQVTEHTQTAPSVGTTTCAGCTAEYNAYAASLTGELAKFSHREAPYDQEAPADPEADARLRQQLGMDAADSVAVLDELRESGRTARDRDGREYGAGARVKVAAESDPLLGREATVKDVGRPGPGGTTVYLTAVDGFSADSVTVRWADQVRVIEEEPAPVPAPAVKLTQARPADPAPTSVRVDGRTVVLADASLVELACIHGEARARAQHLNPHEGRRYFRARDEADAALAEIRRRVDTLYRARAAAGEGSGLDDVLAVIDAADRRPASN